METNKDFVYLFTVTSEHVARFLRFTIPNMIQKNIEEKIYVFVGNEEEKKYLENNSDKFSKLNIVIKTIDKANLTEYDKVLTTDRNEYNYGNVMFWRMAALGQIKENNVFYSDVDVLFNTNPSKKIKGLKVDGKAVVAPLDEYYKMVFMFDKKRRKQFSEVYDLSEYYCSGTMYINKDELTELMSKKTYSKFINDTKKPFINDMHYLNWLTSGGKANALKPLKSFAQLSIRGKWWGHAPEISHFAGVKKPWETNFSKFKKLLYRKEYKFIREYNESFNRDIGYVSMEDNTEASIIFNIVDTKLKWKKVSFRDGKMIVEINKTYNLDNYAKEMLYAEKVEWI